MVCDCCGKKRKLFESFACAVCNDFAYRVRDDANGHNKEEYEKHIKDWKKRAKKPSDLFLSWQQEFLAPLKKAFIKEETQSE